MRGDWRDRAACRRRPDLTPLFFPDSPFDMPVEVADLCRSCPVHRECDTWAIVHDEVGIWAGRTELQRRAARAAVRRRAHVDGEVSA